MKKTIRRFLGGPLGMLLAFSLCLSGCREKEVEKLPTIAATEETQKEIETDPKVPAVSEPESDANTSGTDEGLLGSTLEVVTTLTIGNSLDHEIVAKNLATIASGVARVFDLTDDFWWMQYDEAWTKETLVKIIDQYTLPDGEYYLDGSPLNEDQKAELMKLRAMNSIQATPVINYGVVMRNTAVKMFPTAKRLTKKEQGMYVSTDRDTFDLLRESLLTVGEGVLILNISTDGNYCFVQAENDCGWVAKKDLLLCDRENMKNWLTALDFAIVTSSDVEITAFGEEMTLRMGTRLLYQGETENSLFVLLPCPSELAPYALTSRNGTYQLILAKDRLAGDLPVCSVVKDKTDFSLGYLPLNDEQVAGQAKKLLGVSYGWGDEEGMDCSSTVNAVFRSFGLKLPRNTVDMMKVCGGNSNVVTDIRSFSSSEKQTAISICQVGTILLMEGHVMIYMGKSEEEMMILHNVVAYMDPTNTIYCPIGSCVMTPITIVSRDQHYYERINYLISFY